jgi:AhpD family alkylhydroperoxidase
MDQGRSSEKLSRLQLLSRDQAPPLARDWYPSNRPASALTRSLASAPDLMETLMPWLDTILGAGSIDLRTKELVIMRVSQLNGCRYCLAAHRPAAREAGLSDNQLEAICGGGPIDVLSDRERALLAWVDEVTLHAGGISDRLVAQTLDWVRDDQLIELTLLAGAVTMLNQYCTAFELPPPGSPS